MTLHFDETYKIVELTNDQIPVNEPELLIEAKRIMHRIMFDSFENSDYHVKKMVDEYQRRKDYIVNGINSIDNLKCTTPKGSFYLFVNFEIQQNNNNYLLIRSLKGVFYVYYI